MSTPPVPEQLRFRPGPHGDPPSWVLSHLNREQLLQIYKAQLDYEKAVAAAHSKLLEGLSGAVK